MQKILDKIEKEQLEKLKIEILQENPNCPDELKQYLMQDAYSMIGMRERTLSKEIEQRWNALERGLTKIGRTPKDFIEQMENNEK
ncbi:hypothetical protein [Zunongwangia atlantica]|uniref:Uncharacterized protein n=1 Tax=Zunongwangia atlantica 22II14-10F7 TaxID=1185767 RepID=A0A1Y1T5M0_9FLAO|nr:hypothetical protein [Zunongwangia atlantica]ORL46347.1 hypothetical protein IIF7_07246 [Zunongwangia atlantica 22II14-10F7]